MAPSPAKRKPVRVHVDAKQLKKLKKHPKVLAELKKTAKRLAQQANATLKQKQSYPDYGYGVTPGGEYPHAAVFTRSRHAKYSNAKHQTLAKLPTAAGAAAGLSKETIQLDGRGQPYESKTHDTVQDHL